MSSGGNGLTNGKAAKKRRRRIITGSVAALILVGGGYGVFAALRPNHEIDPSKLATAERGDLARVVVATGKIQPLSKVEVKSKASGIVKKLYVDYGDHVKAGQVLAELDKVQLEASLRAAQANYQAAQAAKPPSGTIYKPSGEALASLGVHEHWNNAVDRKYSRNLGKSEGIELVLAPPAPAVRAAVVPRPER
jgi:multidrug efflux pump subunit AcrA (membrane-fusion protein)